MRGFLGLSFCPSTPNIHKGQRACVSHSVIHTPKTSDYAELARIWEASVRATHDFLPDSYITLLKTWC